MALGLMAGDRLQGSVRHLQASRWIVEEESLRRRDSIGRRLVETARGGGGTSSPGARGAEAQERIEPELNTSPTVRDADWAGQLLWLLRSLPAWLVSWSLAW